MCQSPHILDLANIKSAADVKGDNVRVVTAYWPDPSEWSEDFRRRKQ